MTRPPSLAALLDAVVGTDNIERVFDDVLKGRGALSSGPHVVAALVLLWANIFVGPDGHRITARDVAADWFLGRLGSPPVSGAERRGLVTKAWASMGARERRAAFHLAWTDALEHMDLVEVAAKPLLAVNAIRGSLNRLLPELVGTHRRSAAWARTEEAAGHDIVGTMHGAAPRDPRDLLEAEQDVVYLLGETTPRTRDTLSILLRHLAEADIQEAKRLAAEELGITMNAVNQMLARVRREFLPDTL